MIFLHISFSYILVKREDLIHTLSDHAFEGYHFVNANGNYIHSFQEILFFQTMKINYFHPGNLNNYAHKFMCVVYVVQEICLFCPGNITESVQEKYLFCPGNITESV